MKTSNFNLRGKILKSIMNHLFPKLENICDIFDLSEISVFEKSKTSSGSYMHNSKNKFTFSIKTNKSKLKESFILFNTNEYSPAKSMSLFEFEEKSDLSCDYLIIMSKLFLEKIKTYSEKENEVNKVINELNQLEIIYKKEFLLEKIKREVQKPKKTRERRAIHPDINNLPVGTPPEELRRISRIINLIGLGEEIGNVRHPNSDGLYCEDYISQILKF